MARLACEGQPSNRTFLTKDERTLMLTPQNLFNDIKKRFKKGKIR